MTDEIGDDTNGSDAVGQSIDELRRRVKPAEPDALVHRVRAHMDVRARRKRRTVRIVVSTGCAAVVLLTIAFVALRPKGGNQASSVASGIFTSAVNPGNVFVSPSIGLENGQQVTVTAYGFDPGTTVEFRECTRVGTSETSENATRWYCDDDTLVSADVTRLTDVWSDGKPQYGPGDPTLASAEMSLVADRGTFTSMYTSTGRWARAVENPDLQVETTGECKAQADRVGAGTTVTDLEPRDALPPIPGACVVMASGIANNRPAGHVSFPVSFAGAEIVPMPSKPGQTAPTVTPTTGPAGNDVTTSGPAHPTAWRCPQGADRAVLRVFNESRGQRDTHVIAEREVTGGAPGALLDELCQIASRSGEPGEDGSSDCALAGPDIVYAAVVFTANGRNVTTVAVAVAGCAYWGIDEMAPVVALGKQLDAHEQGIVAIGDTFDYDLATALEEQPRFPPSQPTTTRSR